MFAGIKDKTTSAMAKAAIQSKLGMAGTVEQLCLNTGDKTIELTLVLSGETTPIKFYIEAYSIQKTEKNSTITLEKFNCSRAWVQILVESHLKGRPFQIPGMIASALA